MIGHGLTFINAAALGMIAVSNGLAQTLNRGAPTGNHCKGGYAMCLGRSVDQVARRNWTSPTLTWRRVFARRVWASAVVAGSPSYPSQS
jgi:hypothetical protein